MNSFNGGPTEASRLAKLELNSRLHEYNEHLERLADLYDSDVSEWQKLPILLQDRSGQYRDSRAAYRRAVAAGAIRDDKNAAAEKGQTSW
ncbi:MAG: hypothetical protein M3492_14070 [Actinomycetota bacterium]|nr:hypothetical protein [Actinomycetota bacterium]